MVKKKNEVVEETTKKKRASRAKKVEPVQEEGYTVAQADYESVVHKYNNAKAEIKALYKQINQLKEDLVDAQETNAELNSSVEKLEAKLAKKSKPWWRF